MFVDQIDEPVSEAGREVRPEIGRAVFVQAACDVNARIFFESGVADVRIGFVVAQQDVEFRHVPLDEIVLKRQRLFLVVHDDVFEVRDLPNERTGLCVLPARFEEIGSDTVTQRARLADVENLAAGVLKQVHPGLRRQLIDFFAEFHLPRATIGLSLAGTRNDARPRQLS